MPVSHRRTFRNDSPPVIDPQKLLQINQALIQSRLWSETCEISHRPYRDCLQVRVSSWSTDAYQVAAMLLAAGSSLPAIFADGCICIPLSAMR